MLLKAELSLGKLLQPQSGHFTNRNHIYGMFGRIGVQNKAYMLSVRKPEGKILLGKQRRIWVDNIKMDLREME
jgi:hypothetical protein